jgi:hypothetical protein
MKHFLPFFFFLSSISAIGQNLVPNPSFEDYSSCPTGQDQIGLAEGWFKCSKSASTPDYYNVCAPSSGFGIPSSVAAYQEENRSCGAYAGLLTWENVANGREHIGIELSQQLTIGQRYYLSFLTVMGEDKVGALQFGMPSNNIGMRLTTVEYDGSNPAPIDNFAQVYSEVIITDSANWALVSGSFIADSAYGYLMLGNFFDNLNTDTSNYSCTECFNVESYYLVDDVCISTDSALCNGGMQQLPCNVSVEEDDLKPLVSIYPNPANDVITINKRQSSGQFNISIYNSLGQMLFQETNITSSAKQINIEPYENGILFIRVESTLKSTTYKLLKQ